ncbi:30S ribosomal protein S12 methylthiotransferase RimO [candidate division KSB1 bacterium]|nr:30S ribosomal protein S12 methylthiotransferase RimO [candidate division KSB1 bacterium]
MKATYISLGCPKNSVDLEIILGHLDGSVEWVDDPQEADATIINTCAFIDSAKEEAIDIILEIAEFKKVNNDHQVLVCGCLPQRYKERLAQEMPEIDMFFETLDPHETAKHLADFLEIKPSRETVHRKQLTPPHTAFLTIAQGCDNRCSYCAIPLIKGHYCSREPKEIMAEARILAERGVRELIVIAQDSTYYGRDKGRKNALRDLLIELNEIRGLDWIRVLYTHPHHWSEELIEAFAELPRVVKAVDLPIQHINDRLLGAMRRKTRRRDIESLLYRLRERVPGIAIRTSLIVGYPGESEKEYQELLDFVAAFEFDRLGVFTYSHEEETPAFHFADDISPQVKLARREELMLLQAEISATDNQKWVNQTVPVLIDEWYPERHLSIGRTYRDAPEIDNSVLISTRLEPGRFYSVFIESADIYDLIGKANGQPIISPAVGPGRLKIDKIRGRI